MTSQNLKWSENQAKLLLSNEKFYRSTAIYYLYAQKNKTENYLWFYPEIDEDHLAELRDWHPDTSSKWGDQYSNWVSKTGKDHLADCLKYAYLARDLAAQTFKKIRFRFCKAPSLLRRFESTQSTDPSENSSMKLFTNL